MYHRWLDRWDERQSELGLAGKRRANFAIGGRLAFPTAEDPKSVAEFAELSKRALEDEDFYKPNEIGQSSLETTANLIQFRSEISTDSVLNNTASAALVDSGKRNHAVVVFHHWGAKQRNDLLAKILVQFGISVVQMALPYHLERGRSEADTDLFVSPNLGRTVQSLRQGVLDGHRLVEFLKGQDYRSVSVLGTSLGSWVAALVAAHNPSVTKAALMLAGGSAADVVWTGRATRLVRESLQSHLTQDQLREVWSPLDLSQFAESLSRPELQLLFVLGKRDEVVRPEVSQELISRLKSVGAVPVIKELNCGHRSLGRFPHNVMALFALLRFLRN